MINFQRYIDNYKNAFAKTAALLRSYFRKRESRPQEEIYPNGFLERREGELSWRGENKQAKITYFLTRLIKDSKNHKRLKDLKECHQLLVKARLHFPPDPKNIFPALPKTCKKEQAEAISLLEQAGKKFESFLQNDFDFIIKYGLKKAIRKIKL